MLTILLFVLFAFGMSVMTQTFGPSRPLFQFAPARRQPILIASWAG